VIGFVCDYASMLTMLPTKEHSMLLLWPGLCCLYAALWLPIWPELRGASMVWTVRLLMLASMMHLWATLRSISFPVMRALLLSMPKNL
jgi:hypothetical protein